MGKRDISCRRDAAIALMYHPHTGIFFRIFVGNCAAFICGTIVYTNDLNIRVGLLYDAVHALPEIGCNVIDWYDNADFWAVIHTALPPLRAKYSSSVSLAKSLSKGIATRLP